MKKFLTFLFISAFAVVLFATGTVLLSAEENDEAPTDRKVVVHYHRWDGDYEGRTIWTWGNGSNGSSDSVSLSGESSFGGTFDIYVDDDADAEAGLILRYGEGWGDGKNDRDGLLDPENPDGDTPNKGIVLRDENGDFVGFDDNGVKHVFVYEGMGSEIIYQDEMFGPMLEDHGTLTIVFYDTDDYTETPEWDIWTWGSGAFVSGDHDMGVPLDTVLGVDGQVADMAMFRVAHIPIAADADDNVGIIFRTAGAWGEVQTNDLDIDVTDIKGEGFKTVFFGLEQQFDDFAQLEAFAMPASIENATAIDPQSALVEFNKGIAVREGEEILFDASWFTLEDKDGNPVAIDSISFTQGVASVDEFMLQFDAENSLNSAAAPYTVTFQSDPEDEETRTSFEIDINTTPPTIRIMGSQSVSLLLGDSYSLATFTATELIGEESRPLYDVRVKEGFGYLSTKEAGVYEIVIEAIDTFGNVAEETITITVEDPCDPEAHLGGNARVQTVIYGAISSVSLILAGAFVALRRNRGGQ